MRTLLFVQEDSDLANALRWSLRTTGVHPSELRVVLSPPKMAQEGLQAVSLEVPDDAPETSPLLVLQKALDERFGADGWDSAKQLETDAKEEGSESTPESEEVVPVAVTVQRSQRNAPVKEWLRPPETRGADRVILVLSRGDKADGDAGDRWRAVFTATGAEVLLVLPGTNPALLDAAESGSLLLPIGNGPHAKTSMELALEMHDAGNGEVTALHVARPLGSDSTAVGRRTIERRLKLGLGERASDVRRMVVVENARHTGILAAQEELGSTWIVMGATQRGALGERLRGAAAIKVAKAGPGSGLVVCRATLPITGRTRQWLVGFFERRVPQLEREDRVALVERVASNSAWDFDFVTLTSLSTLIAAMGLVVDSAAVIIGAMLVAPLMTPIMGIGMALVQGNPALVRLGFRSVLLGFLTAFVLSMGVGFAQPDLFESSNEMTARNWPGLLDLAVAFAAGLAGAYSSSRPTLFAALPGVAIAAALVPPIATAGLALAIGDYDLSLGASLLFFANFVAIILASAGVLWATGLRASGGGSRTTRWLGWSVVVVTLVLAVGLSRMPSLRQRKGTPPPSLIADVEAALGDGYRLVRAQIRPGAKPPRVLLELGGPNEPTTEMAQRLQGICEEVLGQSQVLELRHRFEFHVELPAR